MSLALPLQGTNSTIHKLSRECSFDFLGDCFLIMSDVAHVDLFCLALIVVTIFDTMIFGQTFIKACKPSHYISPGAMNTTKSRLSQSTQVDM